MSLGRFDCGDGAAVGALVGSVGAPVTGIDMVVVSRISVHHNASATNARSAITPTTHCQVLTPAVFFGASIGGGVLSSGGSVNDVSASANLSR